MRPLYLARNVGLALALAAVAFGAEPASIGPPFTVPIDADGVQRTTVILDSYSYQPGHLVVEKGKPVELTLKSVTTLTPHNFIIKDPAGSLSVEQDVGAGKTALLKFTPVESGTFPIYCDKRLWPLPSHRDKGMEGKLEVR
jgi:heme/copper-type cytochrome/quinol oxidase subunit 2